MPGSTLSPNLARLQTFIMHTLCWTPSRGEIRDMQFKPSQALIAVCRMPNRERQRREIERERGRDRRQASVEREERRTTLGRCSIIRGYQLQMSQHRSVALTGDSFQAAGQNIEYPLRWDNMVYLCDREKYIAAVEREEELSYNCGEREESWREINEHCLHFELLLNNEIPKC